MKIFNGLKKIGKIRAVHFGNPMVKCFTNNFTNKSLNNRVTRLNIKYLRLYFK